MCQDGLVSNSSSREARSFPWCDLLHGSRWGATNMARPPGGDAIEGPAPTPLSFPGCAQDKGSLWEPVMPPTALVQRRQSFRKAGRATPTGKQPPGAKEHMERSCLFRTRGRIHLQPPPPRASLSLGQIQFPQTAHAFFIPH